MTKTLCIYGTGGFGREVLCCFLDTPAAAHTAVCFMEADEHYQATELMGVPVIRRSAFDPARYDVVVAIGDPATRRRVVADLPAATTYATLIHPSAVLSRWVEVGAGTVITAGVVLTCHIRLGRHAQLNLHTTIGHDCTMGDYFTTAPAANVSGNCTFGNCVYVGTNAAVRQGVRLASHVTIGMGAVVLQDVAEAGTYAGNPLRRLDKG